MRLEELSASLAGAVMEFEEKHMGVRPAEVTVMMEGDIVLVHLKGVLSPSERSLAKSTVGHAVLQQFNNLLFDFGSSPSVSDQVSRAVQRQVLEVQTSLSPLTGSLVVVFTLDPAEEHTPSPDHAASAARNRR